MMASLSKKSLTRQITLVMLIIITLGSASSISLSYLSGQRDVQQQVEQKLESLGVYLEGSLQRPIWHIDNNAIQAICESISQDEVVASLQVKDENGEILYEKSNAEPSVNTRVLTRAVSIEGNAIGSIRIAIYITPFEIPVKGRNRWILISSLFEVIILLLITSLLLRSLLRQPIKEISSLTTDFANQQYQPEQDYITYTEFKPVEAVLKEMGNKILKQIDELTRYKGQLEERVQERTAELTQSNKDLIKAKYRAEDASRAKSTFLSNMSHELRTPLNAILGFSEMLARDRVTTPGQLEKLTIIKHSGDHLLSMINNVLDLSKIEAGRVELEPTAFDLPEMLRDIGLMFEARAESTDLHFKLVLDPNLTQTIQTDAGKLRQILINLMGNAVAYTREGGFSLHARILPINSAPDKVILQLEVRDSGIGIPAEQIEHIFEPFTQAGRSPSDSKGTGLGLAITKSFVNLLEGRINVESEPGKGTIFRVEFPVALAEMTEVSGVKPSQPAVVGLTPGQSPWRILVVEDNQVNRLLLTSLLVQTGFEIREAENGEEALTRFEQWHPHFIWMDIRMPVMNGYEATRGIRKLPGGKDVSIVALTASVFKEQEQEIIKAGCDDVVHKPFKEEDIFGTMKKHLGLEYIYEKEVSIPKKDEPVVVSHEIQELIPPSMNELKKLHRLAMSGDMHGVKYFAQKLKTDDKYLNFAGELLNMAGNYEGEKIVVFVEKYLEKKQHGKKI